MKEPLPMTLDPPGFDFEILKCDALSATQREEILGLFEMNYRNANPTFLDKSLGRLRHVAIAYRDGVATGFGIGESRVMNLPRLPDQVVMLAGLCCIAPDHRRRGLFRKLANLAAAATPVPEAPRRLFCGRMAHPAALRGISSLAEVVPAPGVRPTPLQQETGKVIAEAYGVFDFDPETFVCIGGGHPIGHPNIEFEVEPHEWEVFDPVDRDRGDALLALAWLPTSPPGWWGQRPLPRRGWGRGSPADCS